MKNLVLACLEWLLKKLTGAIEKKNKDRIRDELAAEVAADAAARAERITNKVEKIDAKERRQAAKVQALPDHKLMDELRRTFNRTR